jgi:hypothetical protein
MRDLIRLFLFLAFIAQSVAEAPPQAEPSPPPVRPLLVHSVHYDGRLTDNEARFTVAIEIEARDAAETALGLFDGELAVLTPRLPAGLQLVREGSQYRLVCSKAGRHKLDLELAVKISRQEPWNHVRFSGPAAAIASVRAQARGANTELQLLTGTLLEVEPGEEFTRVRGFLGAETVVALRWQSRAAELARQALVTCATIAGARITPTAIKHVTVFRYEVVQGSVSQLTVRLPAGHALTRVQGEGIRDWQLRPDGERQALRVELLKPLEKTYTLTLHSEQPAELSGEPVAIEPPQPQDIERESGMLTIAAEDVGVETETAIGLRQVNASADALAAYQFHGRPFALGLRLRRIAPVYSAADRVSARLEETRLLVTHELTLSVEKAGIYSVSMRPAAGFAVADARGEGIEDWAFSGGVLTVSFGSRVLGSRQITVQLEQPLKEFAERIRIGSLPVDGAHKQTARIGVAAAPGIQVKTIPEALSGLREMPAGLLSGGSHETLAFTAEQADWTLWLAAQKLPPRITAEIFNLVTVGDGLVGGSATIRYVILNQGVQQFRVRTPAHWKNVDFAGPIIRRREETRDPTGSVWTISLQEKAWGGYTLVITYDYQFDPHGAVLPVGGVHALDVERESGSVALTSAANHHLAVAVAGEALRRVDEHELAAADRTLIARPVLIAYRYAGEGYDLQVEVKRFGQAEVLQAVADRTQLTTVLTEQGDMVTQATFMVKNNDKQFQQFVLPPRAVLWTCHVDAQPVRPEQDGERLLVPLPRGENRDQAFSVDIVYAQKTGPLRAWRAQPLRLDAPRTDMQTTYAEWELYIPQTHRLDGFGGSMMISPGTTYGFAEAWRKLGRFYRFCGENFGATLGVASAGGIAVVALVLGGLMGGWRGTTLVGLGAVMILGALVFGAERFYMGDRSRFAVARDIGLADPARLAAAAFQPDDAEFPAAKPEPAEASEMATPVRLEPPRPPVAGAVAGGLGGKMPAAPPPGPAVAAQAAGFVAAPMVAGIRPIRVDIPRTGRRFVFTKVLNVHGEALQVSARAMRNDVYRAARGGMQAGLLVAGLAALAWQLAWRQPRRRSSLWVTIGLALAGVALVDFLMMTRLLHAALALIAPLTVLALAAWLALLVWQRRGRRRAGAGQANGTDAGAAGAPPLVVGLAIGFALAATMSGCVTPQPVTVMSGEAAILSARYSGAVREFNAGQTAPVAQFEAVIEIVASQDNQSVRLFGEEVAVQEFSATPADARLLRDGKSVSVLLPRKGPATVRLKYLARVSGDAAKRQIRFGIAPALVSRLAVTLDEPEAAVEVPTAVSFTTTPEQQRTRVEAVIGAANRVELIWTPRIKRAGEIAATVFCQNASLVGFSGGVVTVQTVLDYQITQGELRQARVRLPADQRLMRVTGEQIRTWKIEQQDNQPVLVVELLGGVSSAYRLTLETERLLEPPPTQLAVAVAHALDVQRETGLVALRSSEEFSLSVETAEGLQKVDVEEFRRAIGQPTPAAPPSKPGARSQPAPAAADSAWRFLRPDFSLVARVETVQPQIEAVTHNAVRISAGQVDLTADVNYTIKRAGVFVLRLAIPAGYGVEFIKGDGVAQWVERAQHDQRIIEVGLKERTAGEYTLRARLTRLLPAVPPSLEIVGVHPMDAQKLSGLVAVSCEEGLAIKTESFEGMTEAPAFRLSDVPPSASAGSVLTYKFISAEPTTQPGWKLAVAVEKLEAWVRAEVVNWISVSETLLSGRATLRYVVQNAPLRELRLKLPATMRNVEVTGANIRRRDHQDGVWRVELQRPVRGAYALTVTWEQPLAAGATATEFAWEGPTALDVERETGFVAVLAPSSLKVEVRSASFDLVRIDARELPDAAGPPAQMPVLSWRYLRPGYRLSLAVQRFQEAAVLQALVDSARLATVVAEDGQMMTAMTLAVRNNARQYLELALPKGSSVWSAFVAGQAVRPGERDGKLLLPLERSGADNAPVSVELVFVSAERFPARRGRIGLASPALDVPLKNAHWELYLPLDYRYGDFKGSMIRETTVSPLARTFSLADYARIEDYNVQRQQAELAQSVRQVGSALGEGRLQEAVESYSRLRSVARGQAGRQLDLKRIETELARAQVSNLLHAQRELIADSGDDQPAGQATAYDERSAEIQWERLQQAQELAVAVVQPLRVNLPQRGVRYAFAQVLQTEIGKPMTVSFVATNTRAVNWPARVGLAAIGFFALWAVVAVMMIRHRD